MAGHRFLVYEDFDSKELYNGSEFNKAQEAMKSVAYAYMYSLFAFEDGGMTIELTWSNENKQGFKAFLPGNVGKILEELIKEE